MRPDDVRRMLAPEHAAGQTKVKRRRVPRVVRNLVVLLLAFGTYVLSIGPLYWKWYGAKAGLASPIYLAIYRPLEILAEMLPALGRLLNWYISFWIY